MGLRKGRAEGQGGNNRSLANDDDSLVSLLVDDAFLHGIN